VGTVTCELLHKFCIKVGTILCLATFERTSGKYEKKFSEIEYSFNTSKKKFNLGGMLGFYFNSGNSIDSINQIRTNFSPSGPIFSTN
jgi:hypothetical protein